MVVQCALVGRFAATFVARPTKLGTIRHSFRPLVANPLAVRTTFSFSTQSTPKDESSDDTEKDSIDYFKVLGVERSFTVPQDKVKSAYKKLMGEFHPDRHASKSTEEKDHLHDKASVVTHAYNVVSDPHARALHLLEQMGSEVDEKTSGNLVGMDFLSRIMELREEVDTTTSDEDLQRLLDENRVRIRDTCDKLADAFEKEDYDTAKEETARLQYWNRIEESILEKISTVK